MDKDPWYDDESCRINAETLKGVTMDEKTFPSVEDPEFFDYRYHITDAMLNAFSDAIGGIALVSGNKTLIRQESPWFIDLGLRPGLELTVSFKDEQGNPIIPVHGAKLRTAKRLLRLHSEQAIEDDTVDYEIVRSIDALQSYNHYLHDTIAVKILDAFRVPEDLVLENLEEAIPLISPHNGQFPAELCGYERDRRRFFAVGRYLPHHFMKFAQFAIKGYDPAYRATMRNRHDKLIP